MSNQHANRRKHTKHDLQCAELNIDLLKEHGIDTTEYDAKLKAAKAGKYDPVIAQLAEEWKCPA